MKAQRTIISATAVVLLIASIGLGDLTDGLVAYWSLDDSSDPGHDDSGNGNHGTLVNGPVSTTGILGGALSFDGVDDYVETSSKNWGFSTSATVTAWIKTTAGDETRVPFVNGVTVFSLAHGDAQDEMLLWVNTDGTIAIYNHKGGPGGNYVARGSDSVVNTGDWVFVAGMLDGGGSASNLRIFVNGFEEAGTTFSLGSPTDIVDTTPRAARIGWRPPLHQLPSEIFEGEIDEVRLYNRALSEEEICQLSKTVIEASIDIDPDTLNLNSKGKWITCYIELPDGYDVGDIDVSSILLEALFEVQRSDVQDGVLMVKFDRKDLIFYLESILGIEPPDDVSLILTGELTDGTPFEGSDTIRVIEGGKS